MEKEGRVVAPRELTLDPAMYRNDVASSRRPRNRHRTREHADLEDVCRFACDRCRARSSGANVIASPSRLSSGVPMPTLYQGSISMHHQQPGSHWTRTRRFGLHVLQTATSEYCYQRLLDALPAVPGSSITGAVTMTRMRMRQAHNQKYGSRRLEVNRSLSVQIPM